MRALFFVLLITVGTFGVAEEFVQPIDSSVSIFCNSPGMTFAEDGSVKSLRTHPSFAISINSEGDNEIVIEKYDAEPEDGAKELFAEITKFEKPQLLLYSVEALSEGSSSQIKILAYDIDNRYLFDSPSKISIDDNTYDIYCVVVLK